MNINKTKAFHNHFTKSDTNRKIDFLVLHHVEADSADHAVVQFVDHKVSSHFLIDENGEIFSLVDENDIAYHAGTSYWQGFERLNQNSIGIEFINKSPFSKKFEPAQMQAGIELCRYLIDKYNIVAKNIVGHSDIAYNSENGLLDRKQDPSHLFDWQFFAGAGVGIFPKISLSGEGDKKLFQLKNKALEIKIIKEKLVQFGYKVQNLNDDFDLEMQALVRVFNRRFNPSKFESDGDSWYLSSQMILDKLNKQVQ